MIVGYVRISHGKTQNTARQDLMMQQYNVERVFTDTCSGRNTSRPALQEMLSFVRDENDCVIVESFSRLARSTRDLLDIVAQLDRKGVKFISLKENVDTSSPQGRFLVTLFGALATLEVEVARERADEGIAIAKAAGKYTGGKPKPTDWDKFKSVYQQWKANKITAVAAQKLMSMTAPTWYRRVKQYESME